jgi:hypothetical protein
MSPRQTLKSKLNLIRLARIGLFKRWSTYNKYVDKELKLYRAILDRALIDLFSKEDAIREDVEEWLDLNNPDFIFICKSASLKPEKVYNIFKTIQWVIFMNEKDLEVKLLRFELKNVEKQLNRIIELNDLEKINTIATSVLESILSLEIDKENEDEYDEENSWDELDTEPDLLDLFR